MAVLSKNLHILNAFNFLKEYYHSDGMTDMNKLHISIGHPIKWEDDVSFDKPVDNMSDLNPPIPSDDSSIAITDIIAICPVMRQYMVYPFDVGKAQGLSDEDFVVYANKLYRKVNFGDSLPSDIFNFFDSNTGKELNPALYNTDNDFIGSPYYVYFDVSLPYSVLNSLIGSEADDLVYRSSALFKGMDYSVPAGESRSDGIYKGSDINILGKLLCLRYFRPVYRDEEKPSEIISFLFKF